MFKIFCTALLYIVLSISVLSAQDYLVQITTNGEILGRGTVIYKFEKDGEFFGCVLTACHVAADSPKFEIVYSTGQICTNPMILLAHAEQVDLALVLVWLPKDTLVAELRDPDKLMVTGEELILRLQKGDIKAKVAEATNKALLLIDTNEQFGDSGSPIFDSENKLCGIVSCGWIEFEKDGEKYLWPMLAPGHNLISIMQKYGLTDERLELAFTETELPSERIENVPSEDK